MGRVRSMLVIINKMLGVCNRKGGGGGRTVIEILVTGWILLERDSL